MRPSASAAIAAAEKILQEKYPGALCAFATGSIVRGTGTIGSDIDLVVIFEKLDAAWREAFTFVNFPVEAFVHDPQTLDWFIGNDRKKGYPTLAHMIATGESIGPDPALAETLQARCAQHLEDGPQPDASHIDELRYAITDLAGDLRAERPAAEIRAIAAQLYQPLGDLALVGRGHWSGKGKWLIRRLETIGEGFAKQFDTAFHQAAIGRTDPLLALVETELDRAGGPRFEGDKRTAPPTARL